jgi:hypothetical protein
MTTRLRFTGALDLCMRLLLALAALGVIAMTVDASKTSATGGVASDVQSIVLVHGSWAERLQLVQGDSTP